MIKVALFDIDGIVIKKKEYFSNRLARDYNIPVEKIIPFFRNEFKLCQLGKADLKEELKKYFPKWHWQKSIDDFLKYWFESDSNINRDAISAIDALREKGIKCYLATNQEKYRLAFLLDELGLVKHFDGVFASCELKHSKSEKEFYNIILGKLGIPPSEIVFWESDPETVEIAKSCGIDGRLYKNPQSNLAQDVTPLFIV